MKIAYLDCFSGISGDMLNGAILDAGVSLADIKKELARLSFADFDVHAEKVMRCNISATHFEVEDLEHHHHHEDEHGEEENSHHHHHHGHRHLADLQELIDRSALDLPLKDQAKEVFLRIAEAEAKVHGVPAEEVHFHEVGAVDTIIDVVGALAGLRLLGVQKVVCSPLNVGSGTVTFSHGTFPVPAPATIEILKGIPTYSTDSQAELVTPTGAAIAAVLAGGFGDMPAMRVERIGYGAGGRDLPRPNVLRILVGEAESAESEDQVTILETCLDDQSPQLTAFLAEELMAHGALDVYLIPVLMKKGRPGVQCTVLCEEGKQQALLSVLFRESTTLGVRIRRERRRILLREVKTVPTPYGPVRVKYSYCNGEAVNILPEYEDMKKIARQRGVPLKGIYTEIHSLLRSGNGTPRD